MQVCWNHRRRYCLAACWHQLPSLRLGVNTYLRVHTFGCMSVFRRASSASPSLPSRLCLIGFKPAKPFVCVLPCAYINSAALLNNFAKWTNSATDFPPLFLALGVFFLQENKAVTHASHLCELSEQTKQHRSFNYNVFVLTCSCCLQIVPHTFLHKSGFRCSPAVEGSIFFFFFFPSGCSFCALT